MVLPSHPNPQARSLAPRKVVRLHSKKKKKKKKRTSLWSGICPLMQETQVRSLVQEDPTGPRAKNYTSTNGLMLWSHALQWETPAQQRPCKWHWTAAPPLRPRRAEQREGPRGPQQTDNTVFKSKTLPKLQQIIKRLMFPALLKKINK